MTIVGPGRLGGALAIALDGTDYAVSQIVYRTRESAEKVAAQLSVVPELIPSGEKVSVCADVVLICVPDTEIVRLGKQVRAYIHHGTVVLHTSGSMSSSVLDRVREKGCPIGSMHPLAAVSDPASGAVAFRGSYFCTEGDEAAVRVADEIARAVGAVPFAIGPEFKPLYHAAAVTAAGHVVALIDIAMEMLSSCGLERGLARQILLPLISSAVENLKEQDTSVALTGPYARADVETVERHLESFNGTVSADAIAAYLALADRSLSLAQQHGLDSAKVQLIRKRISVAKRNLEW